MTLTRKYFNVHFVKTHVYCRKATVIAVKIHCWKLHPTLWPLSFATLAAQRDCASFFPIVGTFLFCCCSSSFSGSIFIKVKYFCCKLFCSKICVNLREVHYSCLGKVWQSYLSQAGCLYLQTKTSLWRKVKSQQMATDIQEDVCVQHQQTRRVNDNSWTNSLCWKIVRCGLGEKRWASQRVKIILSKIPAVCF